MNTAQVEVLPESLTGIVLGIDKDIAEMNASIAVLKAIAATQLRQDDLKAGSAIHRESRS